jgi:cytochrome c oxidase assembly factor CtaG
MGHLLFVLLHAGLVLFAPVLLVVTVPLHLIYAAVRGNRAPARDPAAPAPETHVRCPDCRELVHKEARRCRFCGITLIPQ